MSKRIGTNEKTVIEDTDTKTETETETEKSRSRLPVEEKTGHARVYETVGMRLLEHVSGALDLLDARRSSLGCDPARSQTGRRSESQDDYMEALLRVSKAVEGLVRGSTGALHTAQGLRDDLPTTRARVDTAATVSHRITVFVPAKGIERPGSVELPERATVTPD